MITSLNDYSMIKQGLSIHSHPRPDFAMYGFDNHNQIGKQLYHYLLGMEDGGIVQLEEKKHVLQSVK